jgi:hypothetical protein
MRAAFVAAASTLVLMAAACSAKSTTASGGQQGTSPSPAATGPAGEGGTGNNDGAGDTGNGDTGNGNGGTTTKSPTPKPSTSAATGPKIVSFTVAQQPACPAKGPAPGFYYAGQDVILSWKVTGAMDVALSVDGPGIYHDGYGLQDKQQLSFGCGTSPQSKHTYLLTATGNGKTTTQTLIVTAPYNP